MAKTLQNIFDPGVDQIAQTYTIESWHVSQSVDAWTGVDAYDLELSGSLTITGSTFISSSKVLELSPSHPLPSSGINSGSLAVTGSNLAFYDGHQWKKVTIGAF